MRINEITKSEFVEKLKDPATAELRDIVKQAEQSLFPNWTLSIRGAGKFPSASIHAWNNSIDPDESDNVAVRQHRQLEGRLSYLFLHSRHWKEDGWTADASGSIFSARRK